MPNFPPLFRHGYGNRKQLHARRKKMGVMTRDQGGGFVVTSDRILGEAKSTRAAKKLIGGPNSSRPQSCHETIKRANSSVHF
jgi:hypothetical protein